MCRGRARRIVASIAPMAIAKRDLEYRLGDKIFRGELAWDDTRQGPRPGILVAHEGGGLNDHPKWRAALLAELGYVALACDMYGSGLFTTDAKQRSELIAGLRSQPLELRARVGAALQALAS